MDGLSADGLKSGHGRVEVSQEFQRVSTTYTHTELRERERDESFSASLCCAVLCCALFYSGGVHGEKEDGEKRVALSCLRMPYFN